ncbi:hypothetical protein C1752_01962 [Acaryochloris thomasi RCC1774]|uniref:Sulfotransferase domain-containing protein n=1 Tax=Acaryochloris thomasi RCC1774 TaxID=1764569 RepID=A0A2W1JJA3_9CYAN|nr:sulfotransferase domain-containing protein [Acaryochloris thomasi]PZD73530.1 hypothetical protein C1752_01962 [Acaryochloris thomasi RCC1774]
MIKNFVIIIGAMKCGTSSLYNYIAKHPEICSCIKKEPKFFSTNDTFKMEDYQNLWVDYDPSIHKMALEASTTYTKTPHFPDCAERISEFSKEHDLNFHFIYIMRNPFDRIESTYIDGQVKGWKSTEKLSKTESIHKNLISTSKYFTQVNKYSNYFTNDNILMLSLDELISDKEATLLKVFDFLNLDESISKKCASLLDKVYNSRSEKLVVSSFFKKAARFLEHNIPFDDGFRTLRRKIKKIVGKQVDESLYRLSDYQKEMVYSELEDDMKRLQDVYKFDVKEWGFEFSELKN